MQPTERFSDRVDDYVKYRPTYPAAAIDFVVETLRLASTRNVVADVGSGTGIFTSLLLDRQVAVRAIEPNDAMRTRAETLLSGTAGFSSHAGTAEATGLATGSVDAFVAAQAFHWFDPQRAHDEAIRILRTDTSCPTDASDPNAALLWNARQVHGSSFLEGYEELLLRLATDYARVRHQSVASREAVEVFFGGRYMTWSTTNEQRVDWDGLRGRASSASYVPAAQHPDHDRFFTELRALFERTEDSGHVHIVYEVDVRYARIR